MPRRCVAANCSNEPSEHVSLFRFPKDAYIRQQWTNQVQRTRDDWKGPTDNSVVCSEHFPAECFSEVTKLKEGLGFKVQHKRVLIPTAIPTIFNRKREGDMKQSAPKRSSSAIQKLERKRVAAEMLERGAAKEIAVQSFSTQYINFEREYTESCNQEKQQNAIEVSCQTDLPKISTRDVSVSAKMCGKAKATQAAVELEKIVTNATLCRDLKKLSGDYQTSLLEAFHSLLIQFAPKMLVYTYEGMLCRIILAALHFNENARREQRTTQQGEKQYTIHYPKFKQGGYIVKKVLVDPTFDYVDDLMTRVAVTLYGEEGEDDVPLLSVPPPLNANFIHPSKPEAVQAHISRFQST